MTAAIFIASKSITISGGVFNHLYLVYDADGDASTINDQYIIRGGPEDPPTGGHGKIVIENGIALYNSQDSLYIDPDNPALGTYTAEDRFYTALDLQGRSADDVWAEMQSFVSQMGPPDILPGFVNTEVDYVPSSLNSNTIVASVLSNSGLLIQENLPYGFFQFQFPASDCILGKSDASSGDHLYIGSAIEYIDGRDGIDLADFSKSDEKVTVYLDQEIFVSGSTGFFDTIKNIENVTGTDYNDTIKGDNKNNILHGGAGIDVLNGGGGVDTVYGNAGNDTIIFNTVDNSFFAVSDEMVYGGTGDTDKLRIELTTAGLTGALRDEMLAVYRDWTVNQTGPDKHYDFSILKLQAYEFENLEVAVDGKVVDLSTVAKNDNLMLLMDGMLTGDLFADNSYGADYTFGSSLTATAGTFTTINGGTLVISSDGSFAYTALASYSGVDSYTYTVTDTSGATSTATAYFNVQEGHVGTGLNDTLNFGSSSVPVYVDAGDGADTISGSAYADYLLGGDGNDSIGPGNGDDWVYGGSGNDNIYGSRGTDHIFGEAGDDFLSGGQYGSNYLYGGDGNDTLVAEQIETIFYAINTPLPVNYDTSVDRLYGGDGDDKLYGWYGGGELIGGDGNDSIYDSRGGAHIIDGGAGDDYVWRSANYSHYVHNVDSINTIDGGDGVDLIDYTGIRYIGDNQLLVDLSQNITDYYTVRLLNDPNVIIDYIRGFESVSAYGKIIGSDVANVLKGAHEIYGLGGNDTITGTSSSDILKGGDGDDLINGDPSSNSTDYGSIDILDGGAGNDIIYGNTDTDIFIHNYNENIGATDVYYGGYADDRLELYFLQGQITSTIALDIVGFAEFISNPANINFAASSGAEYQFTSFNLKVSRIEELKVFVDNQLIDIGIHAADDTFDASNQTVLTGNLLEDNEHGADYSFLSASVTSGTFATGQGGSVTISSDGSFVYNAPSTSFVGLDTFTYTLVDSASHSVTATASINVMSIFNGASGDDVLIGTSSADTIYGYDGNDTIDGGVGADTMIGGTGNDTYIVDNVGDAITELSGEGVDLVQSSISHTLEANVENLTLTGSANINGTGNSLNNIILGNAGDNTLTGNEGNDTLDGGAGTDTLIGGMGDDIYVIDSATDTLIENSGEGNDTVRSSVTYTLLSDFENLELTGTSAINGTGNSSDNHLTGNSGNNVLTGGSGNDVLDGGTGDDTLIGGTGNDTYVVDSASDLVTENSGEGTDTIQSYVTYTLTNNVENLTLTGSATIDGTGNSLDNRIIGNTAANVLNGGNGNDILDGSAGADTLVGGQGNDVYYVDDVNDRVIEFTGEGTDLIYSSVTFTMVPYAQYVENLTLIGNDNIDVTGNALNNILTGNSGDNILTGNGGTDTIYGMDGNDTLNGSGTMYGGAGNDILNGSTGADTLVGGTGDDTYVRNHASDVLTENANEGIDTVLCSINNYTLLTHFENLTLTGSALVGTGNDADNILIGNNANNTLNGGNGNDILDGGLGADTLVGGAGDDTYYIDNINDKVTELTGGGIDHIYSTVNYSLGATPGAAYVENLTLSGTANIYATGNSLDNMLTGNSGSNALSGGNGNDTLDGKGGADTLTGGAGADTFMFTHDTAFGAIDTVSDFNTGQGDAIHIGDLLVGYTPGTSDIADFVSITTSGSNSQIFIDQDGAGTTYSSQQIATLSNVTGLDVHDLLTNGNLIAT
jgi:Ca2+-binding RTX toxin-like protein